MSTVLTITRAGLLASVQDHGRHGFLAHGIAASGPMDRSGFDRAGAELDHAGAAIEFTSTGLALRVDEGKCSLGFGGGGFVASLNGAPVAWPGRVLLRVGDKLEIGPGSWGNYGYLRFDHEFYLPLVLGSRATNFRAGLGGLDGRILRAGDQLKLTPGGTPQNPKLSSAAAAGPIRVTWGLHAEQFSNVVRQRFVEEAFVISSRMDRMGVQLKDSGGVFAGVASLLLVSDPIVPGDVQILGDGSPIVLMRDHQPTGGYPRIATVISADFDRFAQMRAGTQLRFAPVSVAHAHAILQSEG